MSNYVGSQSVIDSLYKLPCKIDEDGYRWVLSRDVIHMIDEMPAADVKPVGRGTWTEMIDNDEDPIFRRRFECSACGKWNTYGKSDFCPNCGADMRADKEG